MSTTPDPAVIQLPVDQYGHRDTLGDAPNEWWWHIGTLKSQDGRVFGFEVNVTGQTQQGVSYAFAQVCITDVARQVHYQKVNAVLHRSPGWAEYDHRKPWRVQLPGPKNDPTNGAVLMQALDDNPLRMHVTATFVDDQTKTPCKIELTLPQRPQAPPLLVWGTGCKPGVNPKATTPLTRNNYYYSLTHLEASGQLTIGQEVIAVTGLTWMDHEYGAFPVNTTANPNVWTLQDVQLSNGVHFSNYTSFGAHPAAGTPMKSVATILMPGQPSFLVDTLTTPLHPYVYNGATYFLQFRVEIQPTSQVAGPQFPGTFVVDSLCPKQVFDDKAIHLYEGVATCHAHLADGTQLTGTAWIEQILPANKA